MIVVGFYLFGVNMLLNFPLKMVCTSRKNWSYDPYMYS